MSYNVKNGTGMDGRRDYDRTARVPMPRPLIIQAVPME